MASRALKLVDAGSGVGELREFADGDALTLAGAVNEAAAVTLASASTVNIGDAIANTINISGTVSITALGVAASGVTRRLVFGAALVLAHNAASLILPTGSNIATAAGDTAEFLSLGSGNWRCISYQRANGTALSSSPYYETTVAWVAGTSFMVTHNLGVVPRLIQAELVARVAVGGLAIGESQEIPSLGGLGTAGAYGYGAQKKTATQVQIIPGANGLGQWTNAGASFAVTNTQADLRIKVFG